jgi:hypothetical protein
MRLRTLAWLLALGMLVPVSIAGVAGADHDNSDLAQFCPRDHVEARNADNQVMDKSQACIDNELVAPGAHAEILDLELETQSCEQGNAVCEVTVDVTAEHWAHRPASSGHLQVQAVGPTGATVAEDACETPWEFRSECDTQVTFDHVAPTEPLQHEAEVDAWATPELVVSPQSFCVLALAETTPDGTEDTGDEQDEDTARDLDSTCLTADQHRFNGLP